MGPRDGLSEFVSRSGRAKLIKLLLRSGWSTIQLAAALGVTRQAVHAWLKREKTHPCNHNLNKLISLASIVDKAGAAKILREELSVFSELLQGKFGRALKNNVDQSNLSGTVTCSTLVGSSASLFREKR